MASASDQAANFALLPLIAAQATTSQDGDGLAQIAFQAGSPLAPIDLTGISFTLQWHPAAGGTPNTTIISLSAGQYLTNGGPTGVLTLAIPQSKLRILPIGTYAASLVAILNDAIADLGVILITHAAIGSSSITSLQTTARNAASATSVGYIPGPQGASAYQVAVANGFSGTQAQWLASLVGPTGNTGLKGDQGIQGSKGDQGIQGIQGANGTNGTNGATGPQPWQTPPVAWAASTAYSATAPASNVTYNGAAYICSASHTSGASFDSSKFALLAAAGAANTSSGSIVNSARAQTAVVSTTTTQTPISDAIPTTSNTTAVSGLSVSITPKASANKLRVRAVVQGSLSVVGAFVASVFQGGANAVATNYVTVAGNGYNTEVVVTFEVVAGGTSAITFSVGVGSNNSGTLTINGNAGGRQFGGTSFSSIEVTEVLP